MATTKRRWLALTCAVATAAAALTLWLKTHPPPPVVDPAQAQAMGPAIDAYLSKRALRLAS